METLGFVSWSMSRFWMDNTVTMVKYLYHQLGDTEMPAQTGNHYRMSILALTEHCSSTPLLTKPKIPSWRVWVFFKLKLLYSENLLLERKCSVIMKVLNSYNKVFITVPCIYWLIFNYELDEGHQVFFIFNGSHPNIQIFFFCQNL